MPEGTLAYRFACDLLDRSSRTPVATAPFHDHHRRVIGAPADVCYAAPGARSGPPGGQSSAAASQLEGVRLERVGHAGAQEPDLGLQGDA